MRFEEHGIFEVEIEDKLLVVDGTGPFNEETVKRFKEALSICIQEMDGGAWGQIIVLHDMSLFTPEAEKALIESIKFRKSKGLVASAVVIADVNCVTLIKDQMKRCYREVGIEYGYFDSIESAKIWHKQYNY